MCPRDRVWVLLPLLPLIDQLSDDFREPLLLCDLDGLSYQEIADKLSVPLGTVRSRISRARCRLRDELH